MWLLATENSQRLSPLKGIFFNFSSHIDKGFCNVNVILLEAAVEHGI